MHGGGSGRQVATVTMHCCGDVLARVQTEDEATLAAGRPWIDTHPPPVGVGIDQGGLDRDKLVIDLERPATGLAELPAQRKSGREVHVASDAQTARRTSVLKGGVEVGEGGQELAGPNFARVELGVVM